MLITFSEGVHFICLFFLIVNNGILHFMTLAVCSLGNRTTECAPGISFALGIQEPIHEEVQLVSAYERSPIARGINRVVDVR